MCTIVAIKRAGAQLPLVVGANRDEFYARASAPPRRLPGTDEQSPPILAGVDLVKGGTWMGANALGIFVALTNQRQHSGADESRASRGDVVMRALAHRGVAEIDAFLGTLDAREYNGFNLLYGDATNLHVAYARSDRASVEVEALRDGVWVLPNDRMDSPDFPKAERARGFAEACQDRPWAEQATELRRALGDHDVPPLAQIPAPPEGSIFTHEVLQALQSICVHTPIYGTCSATLLALRPGAVHYYGYADGPPCQRAFADVTGRLDTPSSESLR